MEKMTLEQLNRVYFDFMDKCYSKGIKNEPAFWGYMVTRRLAFAADKQIEKYAEFRRVHEEIKARLKAERKQRKAQQQPQQTELTVGR